MRGILLAVCLWLATGPAFAAALSMNHVHATNTLRCGYVEYEPALNKDVKTGHWRGFDYDIINAIVRRLELKADFAVPTGWGTVVADLNAGKFDMLCSGFWVHPNVAKFALFTRPIFYQPVFIVARADDSRFQMTPPLDNAKLTMAALDGDNPVAIARADFPAAKLLLLPALDDINEVMASVADGKADFTIMDAATFGAYNENNRGKLRIVNPHHPIRVYPVSYLVGAGNTQLQGAINAALEELILDGTIDRIMDGYDHFPNAYYRAQATYRDPYKVAK